MDSYLPIEASVTPAWLTAVLSQAGVLANGQVLSVACTATGAFNSDTQRLAVRYSSDAPAHVPAKLVLKRNRPEPWAIEAGAAEAQFYQLMATLQPHPPAIIPCYAAAYDPASGNSYILLEDLSDTHAPPVTREQQLSIVHGVPSERDLERVIETLAQHHAYWWNHSLLHTDTFAIGYWSRNAERFAQYFQRRQTAWQDLVTNEAHWFPADLHALYTDAFTHLKQHWQQYLQPRFATHTHLTLCHGDAYFANFLCPTAASDERTYLLDWQSPAFDLGGYDLVTLCATFWTTGQRHAADREKRLLAQYHATLQANGVTDYSWDNLVTDYQAGLIFWLLMPLQDRRDGASKDYWWPKMQCIAAAFRDWQCASMLKER